MNPFQFPSWNWQIARLGGTSTEYDRVILLTQIHRADISSNLCPRLKLDSFGGQKVNTSLDHVLFQLHVGDTVHQQSADSIRPLENGDFMSDTV